MMARPSGDSSAGEELRVDEVEDTAGCRPHRRQRSARDPVVLAGGDDVGYRRMRGLRRADRLSASTGHPASVSGGQPADCGAGGEPSIRSQVAPSRVRMPPLSESRAGRHRLGLRLRRPGQNGVSGVPSSAARPLRRTDPRRREPRRPPVTPSAGSASVGAASSPAVPSSAPGLASAPPLLVMVRVNAVVPQRGRGRGRPRRPRWWCRLVSPFSQSRMRSRPVTTTRSPLDTEAAALTASCRNAVTVYQLVSHVHPLAPGAVEAPLRRTPAGSW